MSIPQRAEKDWPAAVIASAFLTGVLAARSLERRGVRVFLVDCNPSVHGFRSIYGTTLLCPNPDNEPEQWFAFMRDLATRIGGEPALLAASDQFVSAIGRYAGQLRGLYRVLQSAEQQAILAIKEGQIRLAEKHGLPYPRTLYASTAAAVEQFGRESRFPVIFKPQQERFWSAAGIGHPMYSKKVIQSDTPADLARNYAVAAELSPEVILQELIQGPDTNKRVYMSVYGRDGTRLAYLTLAELRCMRLGVPTVCEPIDDPVVADICDRFFRALGYQGPGEIELMWDDRDGRPKMMDINPRFTGSGDAVSYAGIDHAWLVYLDLLGRPVEPVAPTTMNFRHVMLQNDMVAIRQNWQAGQMSWRSLWRSYRPPVHFWDVELRDWRLSMRSLYRSLRTAISTTVTVILGRRQG